MKNALLWVIDKVILVIALVFFILCMPFLLFCVFDHWVARTIGTVMLAAEVLLATWLLGGL